MSQPSSNGTPKSDRPESRIPYYIAVAIALIVCAVAGTCIYQKDRENKTNQQEKVRQDRKAELREMMRQYLRKHAEPVANGDRVLPPEKREAYDAMKREYIEFSRPGDPAE